MQRTSAFSALRGDDALFPNDFWGDLLYTYFYLANKVATSEE